MARRPAALAGGATTGARAERLDREKDDSLSRAREDTLQEEVLALREQLAGMKKQATDAAEVADSATRQAEDLCGEVDTLKG